MRLDHHRQLHLKMRPGPQAAGEARDVLDGLDGVLDRPKLHTARLLVSELITNAVRHADSVDWIDLDVDVDGDSLRVEVRDGGSGFVPLASPRPHDHELGGYGLCLVDRLSDQWGVERDALTCVWFELAA